MQGHHGEFEPGKAQYSTPNFLTGCFLKQHIETQNLGKAQSYLGALPAVAPLVWCALSAVVRVFHFFRAVPEMM